MISGQVTPERGTVRGKLWGIDLIGEMDHVDYITMFFDKAAVESRKYKLQAETPRSQRVSLAK